MVEANRAVRFRQRIQELPGAKKWATWDVLAGHNPTYIIQAMAVFTSFWTLWSVIIPQMSGRCPLPKNGLALALNPLSEPDRSMRFDHRQGLTVIIQAMAVFTSFWTLWPVIIPQVEPLVVIFGTPFGPLLGPN